MKVPTSPPELVLDHLKYEMRLIEASLPDRGTARRYVRAQMLQMVASTADFASHDDGMLRAPSPTRR
jgi:hypothetical protein